MDRLIDLIVEEIGPVLQPMWESTGFWRLLTFLLLLVLTIMVTRRKAIARRIVGHADSIEHDRDLFQSADSILSEVMIDHFLDDVVGDHSYRKGLRASVADFTDFLGRESNIFKNRRLRKSASQAHDTFQELMWFLAKHFFFHPKGQEIDEHTRYCMYPEFNVDRGGDLSPERVSFYSEQAERLKDICRAAETAYIQWRRDIKDVLSR